MGRGPTLFEGEDIAAYSAAMRFRRRSDEGAGTRLHDPVISGRAIATRLKPCGLNWRAERRGRPAGRTKKRWSARRKHASTQARKQTRMPVSL